MLDILKMGIMSSVQCSELTVCTVAFPDYTAKITLVQKKVQINIAVPILTYDLLYNKNKCN